MEWDLGVAGVGVLLAMSAAFGLVAQLVAGRNATGLMWLIGAGTFFAFGLVISEGLFGWATAEELQPNYDGLSFDETLLAIFPAVAVVLMVRRRTRNSGRAHRTPVEGTTA